MLLLGLFFIMMASSPIALAEPIAGRCYLGCALVLNIIHCFGGNSGFKNDSSHQFQGRLDEHLTLDLTTVDFTNTSNVSWTKLVPSAASARVVEPTAFLSAASIANQTKFLIYGGAVATDLSVAMQYPIKVFDPANNEWSILPSYGNYSRFGPVVNIEATHQLWTWGGFLNSTNSVNPNSYSLDYATNQWSPVPPSPADSCHRYQHTATLASNTIYIIGGKCRPSAGNAYGVNMLEIHTFDTIQSTWAIKQASTTNGQTIAPRTKHTTTLIHNTTSFLIYGGDGADNPNATVVADYAYLYDFDKNKFTQLSLNSKAGAGPRTAHNAIAFKSYVMIMFGFNGQYEMLNDIHVLNTTDLSSIYWVGDASSSDTSSTGTIPGLSVGATAGIAVAAAVAGIALTAGLIYLVYKKRQQRQQFLLETTDPRIPVPDTYPMTTTGDTTVVNPFTSPSSPIKPAAPETTKPFG